MSWVASSSLFMVGACAIPERVTLKWSLSASRSIDFATVLAAVTVIVLLGSARPVDAFVKAVSALTILVVLVRQLMMSRTNAILAGDLERSERHFRTLVDGTRDVFMMVDNDGRITYASPASTDLFGSTPSSSSACRRPPFSRPATRRGSPTCSSR